MKKLIAWLAEWWALLLLYAVLAVAAVVICVSFYKGIVDKQRKADAAVVAAAPVKAAQAQVDLSADAIKILDNAGRRDRLTISVQQENARALAEVPDADLGVTLRRGLCRYAAYAADPGCAEVRVDNPAELP